MIHPRQLPMHPPRPRASARRVWLVGLVWLALSTAGCTTRTTNLATSEQTGALDAQAPADADVTPPFMWGDGGVVMCGKHPCACNNGIDDDEDGFIDGFDPECTGPFDDDERTFATGGPGPGPGGGPAARCLDCFFDGNAGRDDDCRYPASCAVDGTPTGAGPGCNTCEVSDSCVNNCLPRTPNGCDCFGCCEVERPGRESVTIRLQHTCSMDVLDDPAKCPRCVQSPDCYNPCSPCELCPGKSLEGLPPMCAGPDGLPYRCEGGLEVCGPGLPCRAGEYCYLGCCLAVVF